MGSTGEGYAPKIGDSIPLDDDHAISVQLPTWEVTVGWASRNQKVLQHMTNGYPRFFIHHSIVKLAERLVRKYRPGRKGAEGILFPTRNIAEECWKYLVRKAGKNDGSLNVEVLSFMMDRECLRHEKTVDLNCAELHMVIYGADLFSLAKAFWQHTGDGISSRYSFFCTDHFEDLQLVDEKQVEGGKLGNGFENKVTKKDAAESGIGVGYGDKEGTKTTIRERIAGMISTNENPVVEKDVYLYPSGMSAMANIGKCIQAVTGGSRFLYVDTVKVLSVIDDNEVKIYGHCSSTELDSLSLNLSQGTRISALFCEFPGNPLLRTPDLQRIRNLADQYNFIVICDDTIGTFINVDVQKYSDVVVTSLSKLFSGGCNVMGGSLVLNPLSQHYTELKERLSILFIDTLFPPDAAVLELNSRDFATRVPKTNINASLICSLLSSHPSVAHVYYPEHSTSRHLYDRCRKPNGGYGYLLSILFHKDKDAVTFFDNLHVAKGPSLGTNFTLACPYTLFAHWRELEWAGEYGVVEHLVRISVGMEESSVCEGFIIKALEAVEKSQ
ncbi:hypothetical protein B7494_g4010 [Chlorociboria aeruginascens]|nr:hypothetical protein B7494_g4010 [Chlorociboria aeruginascens]